MLQFIRKLMEQLVKKIQSRNTPATTATDTTTAATAASTTTATTKVCLLCCLTIYVCAAIVLVLNLQY
jgi:hypothetical protein